jgi:SOS-response transcriptional repressor LexA
MTRVGLTKRQAELLEVIRKFISENGYSPSYREMAAEMNMHHTNVHRIVNHLRARGAIDFIPSAGRSITIRE